MKQGCCPQAVCTLFFNHMSIHLWAVASQVRHPPQPPPFVILHSVLLLDMTILLQAICHKYKPASCLQESLIDGWLARLAWPNLPGCSSATPGGSATPLHPVLLPIAVRMRFGFCLLDFHASVLVERWFYFIIFFCWGWHLPLFSLEHDLYLCLHELQREAGHCTWLWLGRHLSWWVVRLSRDSPVPS